MALKYYKPVTPGRRGMISVSKKDLWKGDPEKSLVYGLKKTGGRNNTGRITTRHIGGGNKKKYRIIDFKRNMLDMPAVVERLEYDPNRTSFIALIKYEGINKKTYIIAPDGISIGDTLITSSNAEIKAGNTLPLINIPVGTLVHNIEMKVGKGAQIARSAGAYAQLVSIDHGYAQLKLSSGEFRLIPANCLATVGVVSNADHRNTKIGKAGKKRWMGIRPTVRGVAMNPIDHPHGGGEGKTSGGRHPVSPWGKPTKGKKTRNNKRTDKFIVRRRNKK